MYKTSKEISLLIAGALIGVLALPYEVVLSKHLIVIAIILLLLILYGIGLLDEIKKYLYFLTWKVNDLTRYFCIYAPYEITPDNSSWVDLSLTDIKKALSENNIRCGIHINRSVFKEFPVIVNPYGGVYPEVNVSSFDSLNEIFSFVRNGGVYINIADIPFYYAYDLNLNRAVDTTPLVEDFTLHRSFLKTVLTKRLNHYVFGLIEGPDFDNGITRVIQLSSRSKNLFHKSILPDGIPGSYSPLLMIPYGKGYFLFSTLVLNTRNLKKFIIKALENIENLKNN